MNKELAQAIADRIKNDNNFAQIVLFGLALALKRLSTEEGRKEAPELAMAYDEIVKGLADDGLINYH